MRKTLPLLFALLLSIGGYAQNFDFQHSLGSNKTLYFKILSPTTVGLTYPNFVSNNYYSGYTKPKGHISIPSTVTHGGTTYTVTSITFNTFYQCDSILSVTIPSTVTSIGDYAFYGCSEITDLDLGSGVTTIGQYAFYGNHHITELTIPRQMASIGDYAFSYCSQMRVINFNADSCAAMPANNNYGTVFNNTPVNRVYFGSYVKYIPSYAFAGRAAIDTVCLSSSIRSVGSYAFSGCGIKTIIWGASLDTIGRGAFRNNQLTTLNIPSSIKVIKSEAFASNSIITSLTIPENIKFLGSSCFASWSALTRVDFAADSCEDKTDDYYEHNGGNWFNNCSYLTAIVIGSNVKAIPHGAFSSTKIVNIAIPNSVRRIGKNAFSQCSELIGVTMGNGVKSIGENAFYTCPKLKNVVFSSLLEKIEEGAFRYCTSLVSIEMPSSIKSIGTIVFGGCTSLETITFAGGLDSLGSSVFFNCTSLSSIDLPNSLKSMRDYVFRDCTSLTSLTIPQGMTSIGTHIVEGCTALTDVYFNADSCVEMWQSPGWRYKNYTFQNSPSSLVNIHIGSNVKYILPDAFNGCNNVSEITIPASVSNVGYDAFWNMGNLVVIKSYAAIPPTASYLIGSSKYSIPVYVPCTAILDYQQAPGWSSFTNYQMLSGDHSMHVSAANSNQGSVEYLASPCETGQATIQAVPADRFRFVGWSDGSADNPRTLALTRDTVITATFEPDTFIVSATALSADRGTVIGAGTYYRGDTATLYAFPTGGFVFDSWDGSATSNPLRFPVANDTLLSATFSLPPTDTVTVRDTTYVDNFIHDTTYIDVPVHDTTYIDNFIHDTAYVDVLVHDTTYITLTDTLTVQQTDTVTVTVVDTLTVYSIDTIMVYNTDTLTVYAIDTLTVYNTDTLVVYQTDTLMVYQTDTLYLTDTLYIDRIVHDTVYIHDTVYVGVDDVEAVNYMLYQQGGEIVVEGAEGNAVTVYDAVGRVLATRRDIYGPVRFAAPASGTYLVRVGSAAARRIVVVR